MEESTSAIKIDDVTALFNRFIMLHTDRFQRQLASGTLDITELQSQVRDLEQNISVPRSVSSSVRKCPNQLVSNDKFHVDFSEILHKKWEEMVKPSGDDDLIYYWLNSTTALQHEATAKDMDANWQRMKEDTELEWIASQLKNRKGLPESFTEYVQARCGKYSVDEKTAELTFVASTLKFAKGFVRVPRKASILKQIGEMIGKNLSAGGGGPAVEHYVIPMYHHFMDIQRVRQQGVDSSSSSPSSPPAVQYNKSLRTSSSTKVKFATTLENLDPSLWVERAEYERLRLELCQLNDCYEVLRMLQMDKNSAAAVEFGGSGSSDNHNAMMHYADNHGSSSTAKQEVDNLASNLWQDVRDAEKGGVNSSSSSSSSSTSASVPNTHLASSHERNPALFISRSEHDRICQELQRENAKMTRDIEQLKNYLSDHGYGFYESRTYESTSTGSEGHLLIPFRGLDDIDEDDEEDEDDWLLDYQKG